MAHTPGDKLKRHSSEAHTRSNDSWGVVWCRCPYCWKMTPKLTRGVKLENLIPVCKSPNCMRKHSQKLRAWGIPKKVLGHRAHKEPDWVKLPEGANPWRMPWPTGTRSPECPNYTQCLTWVSMKNWKGFSCKACTMRDQRVPQSYDGFGDCGGYREVWQWLRVNSLEGWIGRKMTDGLMI